MTWVENTHGTSLDLPGELAALANSPFGIPAPTAQALQLPPPGPHTAGQAIKHVQTLGALTGLIDAWSQLAPDARPALPEFLRQSAPAQLPVSIDRAQAWLTRHRLGLFKELGRSFKTTNCTENLNALIGQRTDQVDGWRNADQKHRWLATTRLDSEPRLRKVSGYKHLPRLRAALDVHAKGTPEKVA